MRLFLLLPLLVVCGLTYAQSDASPTLSGTVRDADGEILPSAQLILKSGPQIVNFAITDSRGAYTLDTKGPLTDSSILEVRYFGYETLLLTTGQLRAEGPLDLTLKQGGVDLKEVVVAADALPQVVKGDTITFRTDAYKDGTEDKIEDVIARLPGVEVDDRGKITVHGKPLDRILLDGEDVFDKNYKLLSQNVPASYVDQINVLSNYHPDKLTGDLDGNKETALDLRLEPGRKSIAFGELNAELGTEDYRAAGSNLFLLRKKVKLINFASHTTAGEEVNSGAVLNSRTGADGGVSTAGSPVLNSPASRQQRLVQPRDYLNNNAYSMAQSLLYTPTPHLRSRLIVNAGRDDFDLSENYLRELLTENGTDSFRLRNDYGLKNRELWLRNDLNVNLSDKSRLDVIGTLIRQRTNATTTANTDNFSAETTAENSTALQTTPVSYALQLRYVRRLNPRMAMTLEGDATRENYDQFQAYNGEVYASLLPQFGSSVLGQRFDQQHRNQQVSAMVLHRLGRQRLRYAAGHRRTSTRTFARLDALSAEPESATPADYALRESYLSLGWNYSLKKWKLFADLRGSAYQFPEAATDTSPKSPAAARWIPQLTLRGEYQPAKRTTLDFTLGNNQRPVSADQSVPQPYLQSQTSFAAGLDSLFLIRSRTASLGYRYNNTFRQYSYGVRFRHSVTPNAPFSQLAIEDFVSVSRLAPGGRSVVSSVRANAYAYASDWQTDFRLKASFFRFAEQLSFGETPADSRADALDVDLQIGTVISRTITYKLTARFQAFTTAFAGESATQRQVFFGQSLIYRPTKSLKAITRYDTYLPRLGEGAAGVHLLSQLIVYSPADSRFNVSIGGLNLLNQRTITERNVSPFLRSTRSYNLRKRTLYAGVGYKF